MYRWIFPKLDYACVTCDIITSLVDSNEATAQEEADLALARALQESEREAARARPTRQVLSTCSRLPTLSIYFVALEGARASTGLWVEVSSE